MIREKLLAAVLLVAGNSVLAEALQVPGLSPETGPQMPACNNTGDTDNCARVLACVGRVGLWFDGQARGWNKGALIGQRSDGVICSGDWSYGGLFGSATARFECKDGLTAQVVYYAQDSLTGTGFARGMDSKGRIIRAWTGKNVLKFLGNGHDHMARLPCTDAPLPIS